MTGIEYAGTILTEVIDGRICFVSMAKEAEMTEYALKRIVGHSIKDLTEKTYTKRNIEWLNREIEKIK